MVSCTKGRRMAATETALTHKKHGKYKRERFVFYKIESTQRQYCGVFILPFQFKQRFKRQTFAIV